jgi:hypothetical protein
MRVMRSNSQQQQLAAAQQELQVPSHWLSPAALFITHACGLAVAAATKRPASHAPPPATAVDDPAKKSRVRALAPSPLAPAARGQAHAHHRLMRCLRICLQTILRCGREGQSEESLQLRLHLVVVLLFLLQHPSRLQPPQLLPAPVSQFRG